MDIKNFPNGCDNDAEILNDFAGSLLKGMKDLEYDISRWVDDSFWELV